MAKPTLGKLPPRYKLIINPYSDVRLSRCPICEKLTHSRKFALFVHIEDWGPILLGKTCRYCTPCELVMIHKDELERELADTFQRLAPAAIGNDYMVMGTVELKTWRAGLHGTPATITESLDHLADFKPELTLEIHGGWGPADGSSVRKRNLPRSK